MLLCWEEVCVPQRKSVGIAPLLHRARVLPAPILHAPFLLLPRGERGWGFWGEGLLEMIGDGDEKVGRTSVLASCGLLPAPRGEPPEGEE
jgi:hypothetical protein